MTTTASPSRPRQADVTAAYDLGVDAYAALWSPVILPAAQAVVAALALERGARVLDVGAGTGALVPSIQAAAADVTVAGLDASAEMLRRCRSATGIPAVRGDALSLPVRAGVVDAVLLASVLFHLSDPAQALAEAARVLTCGGSVGTATWARDDPMEADEVWEETLTEAGAPPLPARRVDAGLDSQDAIGGLIAGTGLQPVRIWREPLVTIGSCRPTTRSQLDPAGLSSDFSTSAPSSGVKSSTGRSAGSVRLIPVPSHGAARLSVRWQPCRAGPATPGVAAGDPRQLTHPHAHGSLRGLAVQRVRAEGVTRGPIGEGTQRQQ